MQTINLDISVKEQLPALLAKQGDVGRKFEVVLTDAGNPYQLPDEGALSVWYCGTSGEGNYSVIDQDSAFAVEGNTIVVEMISQMLRNKGGGILCLMLNTAEGSQIGMWNIHYIVEGVPGLDSASVTQSYTALSETATLAQKYAKQAEDAIASFVTDPTLKVPGMAADAAEVGKALAQMTSAYPVGAVYISCVETSPASLFGGTWERIRDVFLLSAGDTYAAGIRGGSAEHTLSITELPEHYHDANGVAFLDPTFNASSGYIAMRGTNYADATPDGAERPVTGVTGSGAAHNNMPPYLAVYMWKRLA